MLERALPVELAGRRAFPRHPAHAPAPPSNEVSVAFKVNYELKKAERDRAKKAKKEAKAREREAGAASARGQEGAATQDAADPAEPGAAPSGAAT